MDDEQVDDSQDELMGRGEGGTAPDEGALDHDDTAEGSEPDIGKQETATDGGETARPGVPLSALNPIIAGQLILHYEARDVTLVVDGAAALQILAMFQRRREGALGDVIDPHSSSAANGWFVLDLDQPLAMSWYPGIGSGARRTAIDPVPPTK